MKNKEEFEKKTGVKCISSIDGIKRFSVCVMNPPYSGTLHLDFLEKVNKICEKTISVEPCGWLLDIPAIIGWKKTTYQKYENNISKHIKSIEILGDNADDANKEFGIYGFENIGIYEMDNNKEYEIYKTLYLKNDKKSMSIFNKTIKLVYEGKISNIKDNIKISSIHGHPGNKDEFDIVTPQYKLIKDKRPESMTETQFINWHKSCNTKFMKYCNMLTRQGQNLKLQWLPFMDNYNEKWDDERFYKFFKLTEEEQNLIEKTMAKHIY